MRLGRSEETDFCLNKSHHTRPAWLPIQTMAPDHIDGALLCRAIATKGGLTLFSSTPLSTEVRRWFVEVRSSENLRERLFGSGVRTSVTREHANATFTFVYSALLLEVEDRSVCAPFFKESTTELFQLVFRLAGGVGPLCRCPCEEGSLVALKGTNVIWQKRD
jgi:hypothetical protein